jgi:hypothetical protein
MSLIVCEVRRLVGDLQQSSVGDSAIHQMRLAAGSGESRSLLDRVVAVWTESCLRRDAAIAETMAGLERVAEVDPSLACIYMCELWGPADDELLHHVCDSIDLWIQAHQTDDVVRHIRAMDFQTTDPDIRRHFHELIGAKSD